MKNQERYSTVPHRELVVKDGRITIPSIYMLSDPTELKSLLDYCREMNCVVFFENEEFTVVPNYDSNTNLTIMGYACIISKPKFAFDYVKFLKDRNDMTWDKVKKDE